MAGIKESQIGTGWIGLGEAAEILGVTREAARQLVHSGTLGYRRQRPFGSSGWSRIVVREKAVRDLLDDEEYLRRSRKG